MTKTTFRTTVLAAAICALGTGAWAQTAPQNDAPAQAPAAGTTAPAPAPAPSITTPADPDTTTESDQPIADTWITTKVKAELALTEGVKSMDISVKTVDGVVTLTGTQSNADAVRKAEAVAQSVDGVTQVDAAGLKVAGDPASDNTADEPQRKSRVGEAVSDGWITTKVKAELIGTDGLSASDVSVHTNDGVVVLTGVLASAEQVKKAEAAAQSIDGVRQVDSSGLRAGS